VDPLVWRDALRFGQLDHMDGGRIASFPT
jgi:hypothetical protein